VASALHMDILPNVSLTNIMLRESGLTGYRENGLECKITANLLLRPLLPPKWPLELLTAGGVTPLEAKLHANQRACATRKHLTGTKSCLRR